MLCSTWCLYCKIFYILNLRLGRDDRCLSDHGKEARYPFLDEDVVSFVLGCPIERRMDLSLERGLGEKAMLRRIASSLNLRHCVNLPKRAIQFGAHVAKMQSAFGGKASGTAKVDQAN